MAAGLYVLRRGTAAEGHGSTVEMWASSRRVYLDNLKVILIAAIIAIHGVLGYAGFIEVWSYTEVREVTLSPVTEAMLTILVAPFGFFMMALLFLVAGLLSPPSLERKGPGRYVRDRLLRLGVPFVVYVLLVQPAVMYGLEHPLGAAPRSYWYEFLGAERQLDTGPLWFVGVLLIFSLAYAGWTGLARHRPDQRSPRRVTVRSLLWIAAMVMPASFLIRLVYPYGGDSGFTDLNFWEWPVCVAVFTVGIVASRQGWLAAVPDRLGRQSRTITAVAVAAMAALLLLVGFLDVIDDMMGGWTWAAAAFAAVESLLTVFGSVWLLAVAQRRLDRPIRWGPVLSRSAYGAFMLQTVFLIGLAVALRQISLAAEGKALIVAAGGIAASFGFAWILIRHVPGMARIL